jgi:hypothetical protein
MLPYEQQVNQSLYSNNISTGYPNGLSNWYQTGHLDFEQSEKNQVGLIIAFGRQSIAYGIGHAGAGSGNGLLPPFATAQFYAPTTNVDILKDTYTINPHLVNQAALAFGRYKSLDSNHDEEPPFTAVAIGLLNLPPGQPTIGFPGISFSGGAIGPNNEAGYSWHGQLQNAYTATDNLQWQHGKHSVTFGGQSVDVQFTSWTTTGASPLTYTFNGAQTEGYNASGAGLTTGSSFASHMLGAVGSSSVSLSPEWSARWISPSFWVQDDYKITPKLTLNLGMRWDPNNANYIGKVDYINPNAFTVINAGTCSTNPATGAYHTFNGQAYNVCNGPEDYAVGTAGRVALLKASIPSPPSTSICLSGGPSQSERDGSSSFKSI